MTPDTEADRVDQLVRSADPAAGLAAPAVDTGPLALAAVRAGLTPPARLAPTGRPGAPGAPGGDGYGDLGGWHPVPPRTPARRWAPVAASVLAVLAVVGLAAVVGGTSGSFGGDAGSARPTTAPTPGAGAKPGGGDHTASAGPDYERAKRLLAALQDAVPAGLTVPEGGTGRPTGPTSGPGSVLPTIGPGGSGMPAAYFQAVREEGPYPGYQGYEYLADTIVARGPQVGWLAVRVWRGVPAWSTDPCVVVHRIYWSSGERCEVVETAGGDRVAVVEAKLGETDRRENQWAALRHPDGTVVLVAQGPGVLNEQIPALDPPVFTAAALAALAASARFPAAVA